MTDSNTPSVPDATPEWARREWEQLQEIERLRREVERRDVVLRWLEENTPAALELCPYKAPIR